MPLDSVGLTMKAQMSEPHHLIIVVGYDRCVCMFTDQDQVLLPCSDESLHCVW